MIISRDVIVDIMNITPDGTWKTESMWFYDRIFYFIIRHWRLIYLYTCDERQYGEARV